MCTCTAFRAAVSVDINNSSKHVMAACKLAKHSVHRHWLSFYHRNGHSYIVLFHSGVSICSGSAQTAMRAMQTSNTKFNQGVHMPHVLLIMLYCSAHASHGMLFCDGKQDITIRLWHSFTQQLMVCRSVPLAGTSWLASWDRPLLSDSSEHRMCNQS